MNCPTFDRTRKGTVLIALAYSSLTCCCWHSFSFKQPLTALGQSQAVALGQTALVQHTPFWRIYTSDLGRTMDSTRLLLKHYQDNVLVSVIVDKRLREVAKGAREGLPKATSYIDALRIFHEQHGPNNDLNKEPPLLESEQDVERRLQNWLLDIVRDAVKDINTTIFPLLNVLAISHSGCIRTLVKFLVPESIPSPSDNDNAEPLNVPNMSVTIIDLNVVLSTKTPNLGSELDNQGSSDIKDLWDAKLLKLCWCPHLERV